MIIPTELSYTSDHEWLRNDGDGRHRVGITDYAQDALGDIVFVRLPAVGDAVQAGATIAEVESTKSVSDVYAPIAGTVVEVNAGLEKEPEQLNGDPYGDGWICVIDAGKADPPASILDAGGYRRLTNE